MNTFENTFTEQIFTPCSDGDGVTNNDFVAYMPSHAYIFMPCNEFWSASSVNARLPRVPVLTKSGRPKRDKNGNPVTILASTWLDRNRPVEQMAWCPGMSKLIPDRLVVDGGWIERPGVTLFNLYRPSRAELGDAAAAKPWLDHVHKVFPDDSNHIIPWLAHRMQRPEEKINHCLVLGSNDHGVGKDTLLDPLRYAVGPGNFQDIGPTQLLGRFNSFAKSVVLRINEARDLGEIDRFAFYDRSKLYTASPPEVIRVDEKHLREHYVFNVVGLIITTNHKDGIFLPAEDRRHYVAWSRLRKEDFTPEYWDQLWAWYESGGRKHVAAYLAEFDLSEFNPKAPPPKTEAFWDIVHIGGAPEDRELADVIEQLCNPDAFILPDLIAEAPAMTAAWLQEPKNRRAIPHRLGQCGYVSVHNPDSNGDGRWRVGGANQTIYAKHKLSPLERQKAAQKLRDDKAPKN
jgi:hypothetical protein